MKWSSKRELEKLKQSTHWYNKPKKNKKANQTPVKKMFANYKAYLMSKDWEKLKKIKLSSVGNSCQICNSPENLHIHHRTYKRIYNENLKDLTVLCASCHLLFHQQTWSEEKIEAEVYKKIESDYGFFLK